MEKQKKYSLYIYLSIFFLSVGFLLGILFTWMQKEDLTYVPVSSNLSLEEQRKLANDLDFQMFWQVWNIVKSEYVDSDKVKDKDLFYGAVAGIVKALKDPYSMFLDPEESKMFQDDLSGSFEGIGAEIGIRDGVLTVIAPLANSPAEKAGLKAGDKIFKVDGEEAFDWSVDKAVKKIRGPKGSKVVLTVAREGEDDFIDIEIIRDKIEIPSIKLEYKTIENKNVAYLKLYSFNQDTYNKFKEKINEIVKKKVDGLILDLRGNPGGYLDVAIKVASEWIKDGVIVSEKTGKGDLYHYYSKNYGSLENIKTVVLIDEGSASASEIVAGALKSYKKAVLVGETSFGKGSVQTLENLKDGSVIKITIAKWLTPDGKNIDKEGIDPDIYVMYTKEDWLNKKDPQLDMALKIFTMKKADLYKLIKENQEKHKKESDKLEEKLKEMEEKETKENKSEN